jgi:serine/threonine protein kinase
MTTQQPGSEIAGYRIESLIGRGGMAVVYRAEDMRLGRKVALKLLTPQLADSEQFRQRFIRESRLAASLDHPNIVPIYEAGEADGQLFIAMRYVSGLDLKAALAALGGRLPPEAALRLFAQIGDALDSAHGAGLVHRDVKPGNILITTRERREHGQHDHVYLTDFGLTKRTSELSGGLTGTGHFLGTVDYVSPEQIQGKPVGAATDIYALGCVLYECLTGQLPFRRDDDAAVLWAHLVERPPPVSAIRPELPPAIDAVVERAMAKAPADRYESADALLLGLERALGVPSSDSPATGRPLPDSRQITVVSEPAPAAVPEPPTAGPGDPGAGSAGRGEDRTVAAPSGTQAGPPIPVPVAAQAPVAEPPPAVLPGPRNGEPAGGGSPPGGADPAATGSGRRWKWWIALVAGLLALALAGAGVVVYRGLRPAPQAHGTGASASRATSASSSPSLSQARSVTVPGTVSWTDTGVVLTAGERFVVHASGEVSYSQFHRPVGPDGDSQPHPKVCVLPGPDHHAGLIGRISPSGTPFLVGSHFTGSADRSGTLYLGINDVGVDNNGGAFTATVQVARP